MRVCNGSGPSIPIIESIEILYDSVYAEPIDEWIVFETDTTYQFVCEYTFGCTDQTAYNYNPAANSDDGSCVLPFEECGDAVVHEGEVYSTVAIGDQCWYRKMFVFCLRLVRHQLVVKMMEAHAYVLDYFGTEQKRQRTWRISLLKDPCSTTWHWSSGTFVSWLALTYR